jgi:hypothetical protein
MMALTQSIPLILLEVFILVSVQQVETQLLLIQIHLLLLTHLPHQVHSLHSTIYCC